MKNETSSVHPFLPSEVKKARYHCNACRGDTQHQILTQVNSEDSWSDGRNSVDWPSRLKTLICLGCESLSFVRETTSSEDWDHDDQGNVVHPIIIERYPERTERLKMNDSHLLPLKLGNIYEETLGAYNRNLPLLGAIGIRGIIETICRDRSVKGDKLYGKIDSLIPMGLLTSEHAKILHKLRSLGNTAAHEAEPPSQRHLGLAIDVCEHLLQGVYVIPEQAKIVFGMESDKSSSPATAADN
ncbi:DUF4145 domain-containing protein [Xanthomonas campestris pv. incanae]|uniref:DUF4145 domain-containing protein n=1 Tax=Xanthomonas campestris TaxID=339 RepID=UPI00236747DE|nr:DUF4145 domain-containing protein [Xanthomonas campestris]WDJ96666.1 DUF4145 domain-containing protein [Xanthomonas campestris pv. incanae]